MSKWPPALVVSVALSVSCGRVSEKAPPLPRPTERVSAQRFRLSEQDVAMLVAVKAKALRQIEEAVNAAERQGGDMLSKVKELPAAEHDAAAALGVDWQRYALVRDEIARLVSQNRQREDAELLALELARAKQDLATQLESVRDPGSRTFLQAQIVRLDEQLEKIERGRAVGPEEKEGLRVLEGVRAEVAALQAQQERLQRRVRELVEGAAKRVPRRPTEPALVK